jgi:hypothetical protein
MSAMSLVDISAAARPVTAAELGAWAADQRVFVSSVMDEFQDERRVAADTIRELGADPVWFEEFGGRDDEPDRAYLTEVASSTIFVGLLGREYGRLLPSRRSATHEEFREAEKRGLRIAVYAKDVEGRTGDEQSLLDEVRAFHTTGSFSTSQDLAIALERRLRRIAAEELCPWVKLNDAIFRATSVRSDGKTIRLVGSIHDPAVLALVESMRPGAWFGTSTSKLTFVDRSYNVRVESLSTEIGSARVTQVDLALRIEPISEPYVGAISIGLKTYSADDVTEAELRHAVFEEPQKTALLSFGGQLPNPLDGLPDEPLSDEVLRPILRLLMTEALVGSGRATRLTRLRLSAPAEGRRRLALAWQGQGRTGLPGGSREIEGDIRLP